ncbi:MAG: hypothetical protein IPJ84_06475 [Bdellovibrionales bacterium]|nr:hypothetical protein [Bdellovibrionales bacterium]
MGLMSYICSKKMKAAMPLWLPFYKTSDRRKALLLQMSASTIDRLLKLHRRSLGKGLSTTRPSIKMKTKIPLKLLDGETKVQVLSKATQLPTAEIRLQASTRTHLRSSICSLVGLSFARAGQKMLPASQAP